MIKALRITISGGAPHENAILYTREEQQGLVPDLFEDSQVVFDSKMGRFVLPDYNIILIHLRRAPVTPPQGAFRVKRINLVYDLIYQDCYVVTPDLYAAAGVPQIFRENEQLVFMNREGVFIAPDFQVNCVQVI